jgi:hypothetical protein
VYGLMSTVFKKEGPPQEVQHEQRESTRQQKVETPLQEQVRPTPLCRPQVPLCMQHPRLHTCCLARLSAAIVSACEGVHACAQERQRELHLAEAVRKLNQVESVDTKKADQLFEAADADKCAAPAPLCALQ